MPLSYCADLVHIHAVLAVIGLSNDVEADAYAKLSMKVWITDRSLTLTDRYAHLLNSQALLESTNLMLFTISKTILV